MGIHLKASATGLPSDVTRVFGNYVFNFLNVLYVRFAGTCRSS